MADKYGIQTWEQMVTQVVIHGKPDNIRAAAAGWDLALRNLNDVKTSLDDNVTDLGTTWKGEAYESFKAHIERISQNMETVYNDANSMGTVVGTLNTSADRLQAAQAEIPIPAGMEDEIAALRNEDQGIADGVFESTAVGLLGLPFGPMGFALGTALGAVLSSTGVFDALSDWLNDRTDEARVIWNRLNFEIEGEAAVTPAGVPIGFQSMNLASEIPLGTGAPSTDIGALTGGNGIAGATPALSTSPPDIGSVAPPGTGAFDPATAAAPQLGAAGAPPSLGAGTAGFDPGAATPGTGSFDPGVLGPGSLDDPPGGTGLAGAGSGLGAGGLGGLGTGGLGAGGLGAGGLGTGALGAGGLGSPGGAGGPAGGLGGAPIGGGALGKPVSPAQAGIPGVGALGAGAAAGAGRGNGKGGAGTTGKPLLPGSAAGGGAAGRAGLPGVGGIGGAGQGAGFGDEEEHTTWLTEDEDVWGTSGAVAPGVLR
ncbi:uncharacterized protein YukE [Catenuloplanes nepalensis]|uniref:Uncharacterized protein YukE n=1 Tax=Catenuloplanes nepalensis TaxID=587533 RepID=A0ABT9MJM9_9ACTN|nr:WXG100 family type VII secretion target [Catenuloplanes nepalensis]MDP9791623.1 uncharacterized protein YukE [Catenuloplanes nepalensis]